MGPLSGSRAQLVFLPHGESGRGVDVSTKNFTPQARSAYAALLLIPGFQQLRFCKILQPLKRLWNTSQPKYVTFWSASRVIHLLANTPLRWGCPLEVRNRLILAWRIFHLHRSIDLARTFRTVSTMGPHGYILCQRKGWSHPRWEEVIRLPLKFLSPWDLLLRYVQLTSSFETPGGPLLLSHNPPKPPLGQYHRGVTKRLLWTLGVPTIFCDLLAPEVQGTNFTESWPLW